MKLLFLLLAMFASANNCSHKWELITIMDYYTIPPQYESIFRCSSCGKDTTVSGRRSCLADTSEVDFGFPKLIWTRIDTAKYKTK